MAVENGTARMSTEKKGGTVVYLLGKSGSTYFYGHLDSALVPKSGRVVKAGALVGTVGSTGNAEGKPPHIHFQIRNSNALRVDPYDRLLAVDPHKGNIEIPRGRSNYNMKHFVYLFLIFSFLKD